jgi:Cysteine-rich secretory protein family
MRVRRWVVFVAPCLFISLFLVLGPVHLHQARAAGVEEQRLLELINGYRQENGVGTLVPSAVLSTSATRHSEDMAAHDFFSRSTKESSYYPSGSSPADRAAREGYPIDVYTAENIARGQLTAEEVFEDWRGLPEHDAAMLGEQYTAAGIGHVDSYWTADFGSVADPSLNVGRISEPTTGERTSTPPPATEQTADEREGDGQRMDDEQMPEEQAQLEGAQPETQDVTTENGPVTGGPEGTGQASTPRQAFGVQAPNGEVSPRGETSDQKANEETALGTTSSPQTLFKGVGAEQYAVETTLAEILSSSSEELAIEDLNAGTTAQEAFTKQGLPRVSPWRPRPWRLPWLHERTSPKTWSGRRLLFQSVRSRNPLRINPPRHSASDPPAAEALRASHPWLQRSCPRLAILRRSRWSWEASCYCAGSWSSGLPASKEVVKPEPVNQERFGRDKWHARGVAGPGTHTAAPMPLPSRAVRPEASGPR